MIPSQEAFDTTGPHSKETENKSVGRPTVMTPEVIAKLEEAFLNGANDKEAIFLATISKDAFYDYCKANPEFSERIDGLRNMPKYVAKKNVVSKINDGDVSQSNWYLERKVKDEFSPRSELSGVGGKDLMPQPELTDEQFNRIIRTRAEKLSGQESSEGGTH